MVWTTEELIRVRRALHAMPELALQEYETHRYLLNEISQLNQDWLTIRTVPEVPTAILVRLEGTNPTRTIGYRADMDALPIEEATGLSFSSRHAGVMHACGHDIHMTVGLGILAYFAEQQPKDNLIFFFQPAEEADFGGKRVYDLGAFSGEWRPDEFYGLHDNPQLPTGQIATRPGTLFAGTTEIHVTFTGKGGHAAFPQDSNDAIVAGAAFVSQVQTVVSRNVDPVQGGVVTLGTFQAGTAGNIIAETAHLDGTIRAFTQTNLVKMQKRVRTIAEAIGTMYGVQVDLELIQGGYMPVENDATLAQLMIDYFQADPTVAFADIAPAMTGEDFGFLLQQFPGVMFWLGVGDPDHPLHHAKMSPNEGALAAGVDAMVGFLNYRMEQ